MINEWRYETFRLPKEQPSPFSRSCHLEFAFEIGSGYEYTRSECCWPKVLAIPSLLRFKEHRLIANRRKAINNTS